MRRPVMAVMTGLSAVVLALGIHAGSGSGSTTTGAQAPVGVVTTAPSAAPSAATTTTGSTKVNGTAADTRYGPVQVQITVQSGRITAADAIVYPTGDPRDQQINSFAVPQLDDAVLQAQSAQIDTVSGATFTSVGYQSSLQSAIDQASAAGLL